MNIPTLNKLVKELTKINPNIDHDAILKTYRIKLDSGKYTSAVKKHKLSEWEYPVWYELRRDRDGSYYQLFTTHRDYDEFNVQMRATYSQLRRNLLQKEAEESYNFRGHKKSRWVNQSFHTATLTCPACGKYVQVESKPQPNEISIGGSAVALGCED